MYDPVKDGVAKTVESVVYTEVAPPPGLAELVHCYWELRTERDLAEDFTLHALPDACVNLLFDQRDTRIAGVTQLQTTLQVGRSVDRGSRSATTDSSRSSPTPRAT